MSNSRIIFAAFGAILLMCTTASAQNWCGQNRHFNNAERAICDDTSLGQLDAIMSSDYHYLRKRLNRSDRRYFKRQQLRWKSSRDGCGYNPSCIRSTYQLRISQIQNGQLAW